jgi:RimJ/RimL family protein N-acetyltransferase
MMSRPESFAFSERPLPTREDSWARLLRHVGHWTAFGFGMFAVELRSTEGLIAEVGFANFRRNLSQFLGAREAAWTLNPDFWGHGYAFEAAAAVHRWITLQYGASKSVCMIHPENLRSRNLAEKLGYHRFADRLYHGSPVTLFAREPTPD